MNAADDRALMLAIRSGSTDRLGELYERHRGRVYALCLQMTRDAHDARDLVQETFMRVLRYRERFDGRSAVSTWLYRIARNVCLDHLNRARARREGDRALAAESAATRPPDPDAHGDDARLAALERALAALPANQREVIVLTRYHGMGYGELSEVLGCSPGAARVRVHRAIRALRQLMNQSGAGRADDAGDRNDGP